VIAVDDDEKRGKTYLSQRIGKRRRAKTLANTNLRCKREERRGERTFMLQGKKREEVLP